MAEAFILFAFSVWITRKQTRCSLSKTTSFRTFNVSNIYARTCVAGFRRLITLAAESVKTVIAGYTIALQANSIPRLDRLEELGLHIFTSTIQSSERPAVLLHSVHLYGFDRDSLRNPQDGKTAVAKLNELLRRMFTPEILPELRCIVFMNTDPIPLLQALRCNSYQGWWLEQVDECRKKGIRVACVNLGQPVSETDKQQSIGLCYGWQNHTFIDTDSIDRMEQ